MPARLSENEETPGKEDGSFWKPAEGRGLHLEGHLLPGAPAFREDQNRCLMPQTLPLFFLSLFLKTALLRFHGQTADCTFRNRTEWTIWTCVHTSESITTSKIMNIYPPSPALPLLPTSPSVQPLICLLSLQSSLHFLEFHTNGIIEYGLFFFFLVWLNLA